MSPPSSDFQEGATVALLLVCEQTLTRIDFILGQLKPPVGPRTLGEAHLVVDDAQRLLSTVEQLFAGEDPDTSPVPPNYRAARG